MPYICKHIEEKTIVYIHYRTGIEKQLHEEIQKNGWRVARYNGEDKTGFERFVNGDADVLLATGCIGTGVDRLQYVCDRLIIACLPWTHAEYHQLVGRIQRSGQESSTVDVFVPLTYIPFSDGRYWSWCQSRWDRITFKQGVADAAVDGKIPRGYVRSQQQAYRDMMEWLKRLEQEGATAAEREEIFYALNPLRAERSTRRRTSDLTQWNSWINRSSSDELQQYFSQNPDAFWAYHDAYRQARKAWEVVPYQEAIAWCKERPHYVVGDFGCGEAFLAANVQNTVYAFDLVAAHDGVTVCDIASVPLKDRTLHAAIFSLSLMGTNWCDYLREAHRCLKLDGHLWIAEPTERFTDMQIFQDLLYRLGFDLRAIDHKGSFTFIEAIKSRRIVNETALQEISNDILR